MCSLEMVMGLIMQFELLYMLHSDETSPSLKHAFSKVADTRPG
jgi:hypothetical protein